MNLSRPFVPPDGLLAGRVSSTARLPAPAADSNADDSREMESTVAYDVAEKMAADRYGLATSYGPSVSYLTGATGLVNAGIVSTKGYSVQSTSGVLVFKSGVGARLVGKLVHLSLGDQDRAIRELLVAPSETLSRLRPIEQLEREIGRLRDGWDGSGSVSPSDDARRTLPVVLATVGSQAVDEAEIDVDPSGGEISLRWFNSDGNTVFSVVIVRSGEVIAALTTSGGVSRSWRFETSRLHALSGVLRHIDFLDGGI